MGKNSAIEWTDHTFNPWIGCTKVSAGCKNCYAETLMDTQYGRVEWGVNGTRIKTSEEYWKQPHKWNKDGKKNVFCASLADIFEDRDDLIRWRIELFDLILATPNLNWLLLTKRPENVLKMVPNSWQSRLPKNIWMGTSIEDQESAYDRLPELLVLPAQIRFLSVEPLIGEVDLCMGIHQSPNGKLIGTSLEGIHWVIVGGESGRNARQMKSKWVQKIHTQCVSTGTPFFFKQWGEWIETDLAIKMGLVDTYSDGEKHEKVGDVWFSRVGKKAAGRVFNGQEWNEKPE